MGKSVNNQYPGEWKTYHIRMGNESRAIEMNRNKALVFNLTDR